VKIVYEFHVLPVSFAFSFDKVAGYVKVLSGPAYIAVVPYGFFTGNKDTYQQASSFKELGAALWRVKIPVADGPDGRINGVSFARIENDSVPDAVPLKPEVKRLSDVAQLKVVGSVDIIGGKLHLFAVKVYGRTCREGILVSGAPAFHLAAVGRIGPSARDRYYIPGAVPAHAEPFFRA